MTHTPGPWEAVDDEIVARDGDVRVADVPLCDGMNPTEWQANCHLIAAAPDYHEGVVEALKPNDGYNCEYVSIPVKAWRMILAAHAKAEGRAQ
jgi:hypothetical protein